MIFPKIKESIKHSEFFRINNIVPENFYLDYKKIKNDYIESKKEIKIKLKNDLVNFINLFLVYNIDDEYLENYILDLIHEFGFDDINEIIKTKNGNIDDKINSFNSIKLLNNDINVAHDKKFIYDHCTPEYYFKNKNVLDKNELKNKYMLNFFKRNDNYTKLVKSKIGIGYVDINRKYIINSKKIHNLFEKSIKYKTTKIATMILEYRNDNRIDYDTALRLSAEYGHINLIKFLIEKKVDIHSNNEAVFRSSVHHGQIDLVKFLFEKGADIHNRDDSALKWSSEHGHIEVVKFLFEKGANIHTCDDYALRFSSENGYIDVVKYLVEKGANIHAEDNYALKWSSRNGHIEVVKFLIEKGANIHAGDDYALRASSENGYIKVVKFLIQSDLYYFRNNQLAIEIIKKHELEFFFIRI